MRGGRAGHERTVIPCHHSPSRRGEEGIEGGKGEGRSREMEEREGRRQDRTGQDWVSIRGVQTALTFDASITPHESSKDSLHQALE